MDAHTKQVMDIKLNKTKEALIKNNMDARIVENKEAVCDMIRSIIEVDARVSVGGSQTLVECGVLDTLCHMDIRFENRYASGVDSIEAERIYRAAFTCDYYLASSNAVTMNGELYNVDGTSNRVAAISYGPSKVILVVGENKIVSTLEEAQERVKQIAAPANNIRLQRDNACTHTGYCIDCQSDTRICATFVTHKRQLRKDRIIVLLVKENVGY